MRISVLFRVFMAWWVMAMGMFSPVALATTDITQRDEQALRGVKAMVLLPPEFDEQAGAVGVTPSMVARRAEVYLRGVGVRLVADAHLLTEAERSELPRLLIQFGALRNDGRRRTDVVVTVNVLRMNGQASQPVYIVQHLGQTLQKPGRNAMMRELDLALNLLREDLRRAHR